MVCAALVFSQMNGLVKYLGRDLHGFEIAFFRSIFGFFALLPGIMSAGGIKAFHTKRPWLHTIRAVFGGITMLCLFYAMTRLPLANATALAFSQPLFMLILAPIFLHEKIGWHRSLAACFGFAGVLIIVQPGEMGFSIAAIGAITGAFTMACAMIVVKTLSKTELPVSIMSYFALSAIVVTGIPTIYVWVTPTWTQVLLMAVCGIVASFGQYLYIRSYKIGEASVVAPFNFLQLPFAGLLGYVAFSEMPARTTLIGGALIIAAALYIMRRESIVHNKVTPIPPPGATSPE